MENQNERVDELRAECQIADSELCEWVGGKGCEPCYIRTLREDSEKQKALENWKVMLSNLPKNIDSLHERSECVLCKGDPLPADGGYTSIDLAHPEPKAMKGMFFGFGKKVRVPVGSLASIHMATCKRCKKAHRMSEMLMWLLFIGVLAVGFILVAVPAVSAPLAAIHVLMPVLLVLGVGIAGYFIGKAASAAYRAKVSKVVILNPAEIPEIKQMLNYGWFFFQGGEGEPKLFFKKKKDFRRFFPRNDAGADCES